MRIFVAILFAMLAVTEAFAGQTSTQMKVGITITGAATPAVPAAPNERHGAVRTGNNARLVPAHSVIRHRNTTIIVKYY